jgi:dolichyl-phosphate beta-glucosyltransferase
VYFSYFRNSKCEFQLIHVQVFFFIDKKINCLQLCIFLKISTKPFPLIKRYVEEKYFIDPVSGDKCLFPSIDDAPTLELSVIIPAYEEEKRLPVMLDECMEYLENNAKKDRSFTYEVIVVSDGSKDGTVKCALEYSKKYSIDKFRVLELIVNRGKGGAVRLGMQSSRGHFLLFADADGATKFADYKALKESMSKIAKDWSDEAITIGSRAHLEKESTAKRSIFRTILMHGFHLLVWLFAVRGIKDTQCGFKLLTRTAARRIFEIMHVERW